VGEISVAKRTIIFPSGGNPSSKEILDTSEWGKSHLQGVWMDVCMLLSPSGWSPSTR